MNNIYEIQFEPACPPYEKEDRYVIYMNRGRIGGYMTIKQVIFKAKTRKECQEKLEEINKEV